jgi:hypothetical protein
MVSIPVTGAGQNPPKLIPGRNINMVAGTQLPGGDPYLQRQNEGSIDISTRNPMHLLGGANDYRTVDLPGLPTDEETGDAWLGVFKSFDGGQSWLSTLLPGYPQDTSAIGMASPLHGFSAAADPTVRAGANGMFFYSGIAFDRSLNASVVFVSRFIDLNNKEGVAFDVGNNKDPIKYLDASVIMSGTSGQFLDKTWIAVDIPRTGFKTINLNVADPDAPGGVVQQSGIACGNVYVAFANFTGGTKNPNTKVMVSRSADCGSTWAKPVMVDQSYHISQGTTLAIDPANGNLYIAWRQFQTSSNTDGIVFSKSTDGGKTFSKPVQITSFLYPADQPTLPQPDLDQYREFRSSAFPTMAVDNLHNVYVAWSQRDSATGLGRIYMTSSIGGATWTAPQAFDAAPTAGQFMPSLTFAGGKLTLLYYDVRNDLYPSYLNGKFIADVRPYDDLLWHPPLSPGGRHTVDVRAAQFSPGQSPPFSSFQVSQYFAIIDRLRPNTSGTGPSQIPVWRQIQFNPPDFPLFADGTSPFVGDYLEIAGAPKMVYKGGQWQYNLSDPVDLHAVWTDNRDVVPPPPTNYDWTAYVPSSLGGTCNTAGMRNQNLYTSRITGGLVVGTMGNSKYLSGSSYSSFVIFVQNLTNNVRDFQLSITQPAASGAVASFADSNGLPLPLTSLPVSLPGVIPYRGLVRTVLVKSSNVRDSVTVTVTDVSTSATPLPARTLVLNSDPLNPPLDAVGGETHNPVFDTQSVLSLPPLLVLSNPSDPTSAPKFNLSYLSPDMLNPDMLNPDMLNAELLSPDMLNPDMLNPDMLNPDMLNPDMLNPDMLNPDMLNPDMLNPDMLNPDMLNAPLTDINWTLRNGGNVDSGFKFAPLIPGGQLPPGTNAQLFIYRAYKTPMVSCSATVKDDGANYEILANIANPSGVDPSQITDPSQLSSIVKDAITFRAASNETIMIKLRLWNPVTKAAVTPDIGGVVVAQSVNTGGSIAPATMVITSLSLSSATVGVPYQANLTAIGGTAPLTWTLSGAVPGLSLNGSTLSGTPTQAGTFNFTVKVSDSAGQSYSANLTLSIAPGIPNIAVTGGPFTYDGQSHPATATATGTGGVTVNGAFAFTYAPGGSTVPVEAGTYSVTAAFTSGDSNYTSASGSGTLTINKAIPVISVAGGTFSYDGQPHEATATASGVGGTAVPGGFVFTYNGSTSVPVSAGTYSVVATFTSSDSNYANASGNGTVIVGPASVTLTVTGGTFTYNTQPHPASATASGIGGVAVAGTFSFTYNGSNSPPVNAGSYNVVATFTSSDPNYVGRSATSTITINKSATATTLTASPAAATVGQPVTLTATVSAVAPGAGLPTGSVTFLDGTTTLGSALLNGAGQASITTSTLAVGSHSITANYGGDGNFSGSSTAASLNLTVSYTFIGFASPLGPAGDPAPATVYGPFNVTSNVTIKWQLKDASGNFISTLAVVSSMTALSSTGGTVTLYQPSQNTTGSTILRYDTTNQQYVFNWDVTQTPAGQYTLILALNDGKLWKVNVLTQ